MGFQEYAITLDVYPKRVDKVMRILTALLDTTQPQIMLTAWIIDCRVQILLGPRNLNLEKRWRRQ
jgi:hypothetical protein